MLLLLIKTDSLAPIDIFVTSSIVHTVKKLLPSFEFEWLADELEKSLPEELDFIREAYNADESRKLLKSNSVVHIPEVYFKSRRVLIMVSNESLIGKEYIDGGKVNDLEFLQTHSIDKFEVSRALSNMYAQMIFIDGWVHCDPHPGNVFVRPATPSLFRRIASVFIPKMSAGNFQLVLLDHGLYRNIPKDQRLLYAKLWTSVIRRDEEKLLECARKLFGGRLEDQTG